MFLWKLKAVLADHRADSALEVLAISNTPISYMCTTSIPFLQLFFSCMSLHCYDPWDRKRAWNDHSEVRQQRIIRDVQKVSSDSDPGQPEAFVVG